MEVSLSTLIGSSSSLHSEACNALGGSDGIIHSRISLAVACLRAATNILLSACEAYQRRGRSVGYVGYSNREQLCSPTGNCNKNHGRSALDGHGPPILITICVAFGIRSTTTSTGSVVRCTSIRVLCVSLTIATAQLATFPCKIAAWH